MTSPSRALLSVLQANGIDRVFLVPGESYLGILDALYDFRGIDAVTCRHESGAGFMAVAYDRQRDDCRVERKLPILLILANDASYASIRIQQELHYPGRSVGTSLFNPDFEQIARAFGMLA